MPFKPATGQSSQPNSLDLTLGDQQFIMATGISTTTHSPPIPWSLSVDNSTNTSTLSSFSSTPPTTLTSTIVPNNSTLLEDGDSEVLRTIEYIGNVLCFYYVPIIVGTGSIGNILSVCVFFKTKLRKLSSSFYLAALAVSDTCFLFGLFVQWLNFVDINIYNREYFCQFFTFFSNLACFCSVWFVVAFTVERFIAVMYPLKRQTMCTVRRAKMVLLGLTVLGCLHCAPFWISSTPVYSQKLDMTICDIKNEYKDYITLLNYWDTVVVFAVPFTSIAVLNTFTGCTVWKFATVRRTLTMQKQKTHHLPTMHDMTVSTAAVPSAASCAIRVNTTPTATTTTTAITEGVAYTTKKTVDTQHCVPVTTTYCLPTLSLKRQKSNSCGTTHQNGHENNLITHVPHQHPHPHRGTMIKHHHHHSTRSSAGCSGKSGSVICADTSRKSGRRNAANSSQLKVTKMLLIVSTVFVCLNLPSCIMRIITYIETQSSANEKTTIVLQYIFHLLFITNFGINFVLYCVSGQNFRKAVLSMFRRVSTTQKDITTQITVSEYCHNTAGCSGVVGGVNSAGGFGGASGAGRIAAHCGYSGCGNKTPTRRCPVIQNCWKRKRRREL